MSIILCHLDFEFLLFQSQITAQFKRVVISLVFLRRTQYLKLIKLGSYKIKILKYCGLSTNSERHLTKTV